MLMPENQNKKINVFEVVPCLGVGGAERLVLDICKNINKEKFKITIISLYSRENTAEIYKNTESEYGIPIIYLDKKEGFDFSVIKNLKALYKSEKPDVVHTHLYAVVYSIFASLGLKIPVRLHTVHNMAAYELPKLHRIIMRLGYKKKKTVPVAISDIVKKSILEEYRLPESAVPCVYNGIDTAAFIKKTDYENPDGIVKIINTARFSLQKNHSLLLDSFKICCEQEENLRLVLAGDGPLKNSAEKKAAELGLTDKIEFLGVVENLQTRLKEADIFVLSSDYEGLPLSVLEAMSAGLPVAATDAGGTREPVKDGENGFITPTGNASALAESILKLSRDYKLREKMGKKSAEYSLDFDIIKTVLHYQKLYEGI